MNIPTKCDGLAQFPFYLPTVRPTHLRKPIYSNMLNTTSDVLDALLKVTMRVIVGTHCHTIIKLVF